MNLDRVASIATSRATPWLFHAAAAFVVLLTLISAAQPLFTEDTWWHLSMGRAYAALGPWLDRDPNLFTAQGPPSPAAWLSSLSLYAVSEGFGFQALRVTHAALVSLIVLFAWRSLFRVSGSRGYASAATAIFTSLAAYRLFQLRPDLVSLLAAILIVGLVVLEPSFRHDANGRRRSVAAIALMLIWANSHAGFLLGPMLLSAALMGILAARWLDTPHAVSPASRVPMLSLCLGIGLLVTFLNPEGAAPHFLYFSAGGETPDLAIVVDEWQSIDHLLSWPQPNLPPSAQSWVLVWCIIIATPVALVLAWRQARNANAERDSPLAHPQVDPALIGVAALSIVAMIAAVRFLWMGYFVLLLLGACARSIGAFQDDGGARRRIAIAAASAVAAAALGTSFYLYGAWPMISKGVDRASYSRPYTAAKNNAQPVWFLKDAGLEGRLYNDYASGNFLGYWLSPRLRTFINGSLNVPKEVMDASFMIGRRGWESSESFEDVLDRYEIDVFFATGTPRQPLPGRPVVSTTTHLERTPGWMLIFRSLSSAVYLRNNERNRENLARVRDYYAQKSVPFDPTGIGFDVARVIRDAPQWAITHGLIPSDFENLERSAQSGDPAIRKRAIDRLAGVLAIIGLYDRAEALDRDTTRRSPALIGASRRLVWTLMHQGNLDDVLREAQRLQNIASPRDEIASMLVSSAHHLPRLDKGQQRALISALPMMTRSQARQYGQRFVAPEVR